MGTRSHVADLAIATTNVNQKLAARSKPSDWRIGIEAIVKSRQIMQGEEAGGVKLLNDGAKSIAVWACYLGACIGFSPS